jgi:hypothetical protein
MRPESQCRAWKYVDTIRKDDAVYYIGKLIETACESIRKK